MDTEARRRAIREWLDSRPSSAEPEPPMRGAEVRPFELADLDTVSFRRRRLPHWELAGATYFVTFRVARGRGRPFAAHAVARIVEEAILYGIDWRYELDAYVVMPDHVHVLITPLDGWPLARVLQGIKSVSAREVNRAINRRGPVWQPESFDHVIRGEAGWLDKREYIRQNPVAAGLVTHPAAYPLSSAVTLDPPGRRRALAGAVANAAGECG